MTERGGGQEVTLPVAACFCATFLKPEMLHIYRQITALRRWRPAVLTWKREEAARFPFDPERLAILPRSPARALRRLWFRQLRRAPVPLSGGETRAVLRELDRRRARVLHVYFGHIAVRLLPALRAWSGPVVVSFHGADVLVDLDQPAHRRATETMLARADLVLARSRSLLNALAALGCPAEKLRLQRTGIPLEQFPFQPREFPSPDGAWRFLQACRLVEKKGLATTLRAFADFARTYPRATLTIAGEGPLLGDLRALAAALGVAERVEFPGFLSQPALREKLAAAHLFLHPSELGADGNQEGVPNSVLEAMATGLPVVATTHGGLPEAITHAENGWLAAERDPVALAAALRELAVDPARLAHLGRAASATVAREFEQGAQAARLENCYDEALAKRPVFS